MIENGIELVAGINFKDNEYSRIFDVKNINPVIVNEETVKKLGFANPQESISQRIIYKYGNTKNVRSEIIGVDVLPISPFSSEKM